MDLLEQLEEIFERKRGKGGAERHHGRYGVKPPSSSQLNAGFKRARQGLNDLSTLLRDSTPAASEAIHQLTVLGQELQRIQDGLGISEDEDVPEGEIDAA